MPNALGIGLLGPLQVRDETGRPVHVGGRQLRVLLTLLALNAGRVVPAGSLAGELWPDDPPGNPGNALQTLISRLRAELRQAGAGDVIESHPAGYRLAVPPGAVDVMAFEELAAQGRRALADAAGSDLAEATAARLTELRSSILADRIEADLALGETTRAASCSPTSSGWTRPPSSSRSISASCGVGNRTLIPNGPRLRPRHGPSPRGRRAP